MMGWLCVWSAQHSAHQWTRRLPRVARSYRQHCPICSVGMQTF